MCVEFDLSQGILNMKGQLILWICAISEIVLGVLIGCLYYRHGLGIECIFDGILMIVVIFQPFQWLIIWSLVWQVFTAVFFTVRGLQYTIEVLDGADVSFVWALIIICAVVYIAVVVILSIVVYVKSLMRGPSGYSRTNTFSV